MAAVLLRGVERIRYAVTGNVRRVWVRQLWFWVGPSGGGVRCGCGFVSRTFPGTALVGERAEEPAGFRCTRVFRYGGVGRGALEAVEAARPHV
jgi:hypothetical protein